MAFKITNAGALSTIQDLGRYGHMREGFSPSGALDTHSMRLANILVGNPENEAVIEMTVSGITVIMDDDCIIAVTGGDFGPLINNRPIPVNAAVRVEKGQILRCPRCVNGCRCYLAVRGGFAIDEVMGSCSTNLRCGIGGYLGRKLLPGDVLRLKNPDVNLSVENRRVTLPRFSRQLIVSAVAGPQDDYFSDGELGKFFKSTYIVTEECDRMGMRLSGTEIAALNGYDIISDAVVSGSVQISANGQPMILLADRQTTGGYAKIATVVSYDVAKLAQLLPGAAVGFKRVTVDQAQKKYIETQQYFQSLKSKFGEGF